jgi:predicted nucleic acid-binding protein
LAQVIDASVAIAWCVRSQSTSVTVASLQYAIVNGGYVPAIFWFEVLHGLARLERGGTVSRIDIDEFTRLLSDLSLAIDGPLDAAAMIGLEIMARRYSLSIYDASYVELALRTGIPLATRDAALAKAATAAGATLFTP